MAITVDALELNVKSSASSAALSIGELIGKLRELKTELGINWKTNFGEAITKQAEGAVAKAGKVTAGEIKKAAKEVEKAFNPKASIMSQFKGRSIKDFKSDMYGPRIDETARMKASASAYVKELEKAKEAAHGIDDYVKSIIKSHTVLGSDKSLARIINESTGVVSGRRKGAERSAYAYLAEERKRDWQALDETQKDIEIAIGKGGISRERVNQLATWFHGEDLMKTIQNEIKSGVTTAYKPELRSVEGWMRAKNDLDTFKQQGTDTSAVENNLVKVANTAEMLMHGAKFDAAGQAKSLDEAIERVKALKNECTAARKNFVQLMTVANAKVRSGEDIVTPKEGIFGNYGSPDAKREATQEVDQAAEKQKAWTDYAKMTTEEYLNMRVAIAEAKGQLAVENGDSEKVSAAVLGYQRATAALQRYRDGIQSLEQEKEAGAALLGRLESAGASQGMIEYAKSEMEAGVSARSLTKQLFDLDGELKQKKADASDATSAFANFRDEMKAGVASVKNYIKQHTKMLQQFGRVAKMRAMRAIIKSITSGLKEGIGNLYQYSKAIKGSFATSMDSASTSLLLMKNSIATAVAPVIQALIPVLHTVVGWITTACNWLSQFFALLNGSSTWTRATEYATEYAEAAKKSAGSTKEMLAAFDELNVIQSESGGSGSGKTNLDYSKMFEEVSVFDGKIRELAEQAKEVVKWISDNFTTILATVGLIKAAIAMWNVSKAFEGVLGTIGKIAAGGLLLTVGCVLSFDFGKKLGSGQELSGLDIVEGIGGALSSAIGGALIGFQLAGPWGAVIGGAAGLVISIAIGLHGYITGKKESLLKSKWGDVEMTPEQVKKYVTGLYTFDVNSHIQILSASTEVTKQAQIDLNNAITNLQSKMALIKLGIESPIKVTDDIQKTVEAAINTYNAFRENKKVLLSLELTENYVDDITPAEGVLKNIGDNISKIILDAEKNGWDKRKEEQIRLYGEYISEVLSEAQNRQNSIKFQVNSKAGIANFTKDTAGAIFEEQSRLNEEYRQAVIEAKNTEAEGHIYNASVTQGILNQGYEFDKNGNKKYFSEKRKQELQAEIDAEINEAARIKASASETADKALASSLDLQRGEWMSALQNTYGTGNDSLADAYISHMWNVGGSLLDPEFLRAYIRGQMETYGDGMALNIADMFKITGWDALAEDGKQKFVQAMYDQFGANGIKSLADAFDIDISEMIDIVGFDKLTGEEKVKMFDALSEAYSYNDVIKSLDIEDLVYIAQHKEFSAAERLQFIKDMISAHGTEAVKAIKEGSTLNAKDMINLSYKDFVGEERKRFIATLIEIYGADAVERAVKEKGGNIPEWITAGIEAKRDALDAGADEIYEAMKEAIDNTKEYYDQTTIEPNVDVSQAQRDIKGLEKQKINIDVGANVKAEVDVEINNQVKTTTENGEVVKTNTKTKVNGLFGTIGYRNSLFPTLLTAAGGAYDIPRDGQLFVSREAGPELVGKIGSRNSVANNEQIVAGIANGVRDAMSGMEERLARIEQNTGITANKDTTVKIMPSAALGRVNAQAAAMYGQMTGR